MQRHVARRRPQPADVIAAAAVDQQLQVGAQRQRAAPQRGDLRRTRCESATVCAVGVQPGRRSRPGRRPAGGRPCAPGRDPRPSGRGRPRSLRRRRGAAAAGRAARPRTARRRRSAAPRRCSARATDTPVSRARSRASANSRCVEACTPKNSVGHVFDLVGLVEDDDLVGRQHLRLGPARAQRQVGEEQVVVDDHEPARRRPGGASRSRSSSRRTRSAGRCASRAWRRSRPTAGASSASSVSSARSPVADDSAKRQQPIQLGVGDQPALAIALAQPPPADVVAEALHHRRVGAQVAAPGALPRSAPAAAGRRVAI